MAVNPNHLKIGCVAGVLVAAAVGAVVHWQVLSGRRAALAALEAEVRRAAETNGTQSTAARELPGLKKSVARLARRVPPDPNLTTLLGSAGTEAATDGVPEREIVSKPTVAGQPVARVPFVLQYRGSFASTVNLLRRLQDGPLLTRVERVVMESESATDGGGGDKPLRVQVEFSTFARTSKELEAWAQAE
jgi:Tfp pilus assembly protein PilO